jgi:polyvinyl alcohol dehydrogenase (cytochrome)
MIYSNWRAVAASVLTLTGAQTTIAAEGLAAAEDGVAIYAQFCAKCHDGGAERAPDRTALKLLSIERVRSALTSGSMREQGASLSETQLNAVARFVGSVPPSSAAAGARCTAGTSMSDAFSRAHWNGWGAGPSQRRFQPAAMAGLPATDVPKLELKWAFGFPNSLRALAQPTIVGGRIFVGSAAGRVFSLDAANGCTHWEFAAMAPVRTAISVGQGRRGWTVYFGDQRGNVYGLDAISGEKVWMTHVDEHKAALITGAPLLVDDRLLVPVGSGEEVASMNPAYPCCTFRGSVVALDAQTGRRLWQAFTIASEPQPVRKNERDVQLFGPSGASVWSSPTVDAAKRFVYVTTGNSYSDPPSDGANAFIAFRLEDGAHVWTRQMTANDAYTVACNSQAPGSGNCPKANGPDVDFGSSAMLVTLPDGRRALIAGQKSGDVHALDPDREGAVLWQTKVGIGGKLGGVQWGTAADDKQVYVAVSDVRMAPVAPGTPGAQPSPFGVSFRLDPNSGGGLLALKIDTGEVVWKTPHPGCGATPGCSPAQSAAVTAIPGVVFSGGLDGHLRAYAADSGRIVWDVDTKKSYATVNGVVAQGGSLDGPGAVVVGGMLYVNSGYAVFGGVPGNALLAFSVGGR